MIDISRNRNRNNKEGDYEEDDEEDLTKSNIIAPSSSSSRIIGPSQLANSHDKGKKNKIPAGSDPCKIIVKNLPFEANEKDVRELFAAFSEIRSVRLPRKRHAFSSHRSNNHRGFAFVEFLSEAEAARAMSVLKATHLYGRHLVLQYAKLDEL